MKETNGNPYYHPYYLYGYLSTKINDHVYIYILIYIYINIYIYRVRFDDIFPCSYYILILTMFKHE